MTEFKTVTSARLRGDVQEPTKEGEEFIGGEKRGSVKTETETEKQAYQEEKRKHLGG